MQRNKLYFDVPLEGDPSKEMWLNEMEAYINQMMDEIRRFDFFVVPNELVTSKAKLQTISISPSKSSNRVSTVTVHADDPRGVIYIPDGKGAMRAITVGALVAKGYEGIVKELDLQ